MDIEGYGMGKTRDTDQQECQTPNSLFESCPGENILFSSYSHLSEDLKLRSTWMVFRTLIKSLIVYKNPLPRKRDQSFLKN